MARPLEPAPVTRRGVSLDSIGALSSVFSLLLLLTASASFFLVLQKDTPDLYAPPLRYLDAKLDEEGGMYYVPLNGEPGNKYPGFCLGDRVQWTSHAVGTRDTEIVVGTYLQQLETFEFVGNEAAKLNAEYPGPKVGLKGVYAKTNPAYYLSAGEYLGGYRSFTIPEADELNPHNGIEPGDTLRIFVGITSVLSKTAGYYLNLSYGRGCPVIPPTSN